MYRLLQKKSCMYKLISKLYNTNFEENSREVNSVYEPHIILHARITS